MFNNKHDSISFQTDEKNGIQVGEKQIIFRKICSELVKPKGAHGIERFKQHYMFYIYLINVCAPWLSATPLPAW